MTRWLFAAASFAAVMVVIGCDSPFAFDREESMRSGLIASYREQLTAPGATDQIEVKRAPSDVEFQLTPERREELDAMSGMTAYSNDPLELGDGLTPDDEDAVAMLDLREAIHRAVAHNLELQQARLLPAIAQQQLIIAESRFDVDYFADITWENSDSPPVNTTFDSGSTQTINFGTGFRKRLTTGGSVELRTDWSRFETSSPALGQRSRYNTADVMLQINQPLLRGLGQDVNMAEIVLARNLRTSEIQQLKLAMIDLVVEVEDAYWNLVLERDRLLILTRLLNRTIDDRDRLERRAPFDVTPVRLTEANSFVELRRSDVISARQSVRVASDRLKKLMNDPAFPLADETLILPADRPIGTPISYNLLDAVTTGLEHRPEMRQSLLQIKDASVRQRVADNARLPVLNMVAGVGAAGLDDSFGGAYENASTLDYISYLVGGQFEVPIGNRGPEARFEESTLRRQSSVLAYQQQAEDVVLQIKDAMRDVSTSYELIGANRAARRAAADSLRAIEEQEKAGVALTPEFLLDLKLQTQQRLAEAEVREVQAQANYNTSITRLYQRMGVLLERKGITFNETPENDSFVLYP